MEKIKFKMSTLGMGKNIDFVRFFLKSDKLKLLIFSVIMLCVLGVFFRSSGYSAFGVALAIFLVIFSLSIYAIDASCSMKRILSHLPLATGLSSLFVIALFTLESIFPATHFYSPGGYLFSPYPEHHFFPYLNLYLTIFLILSTFPLLLVKIIIDVHAAKESIIEIKIDKANRLIESCMRLKGFRLMLASIFWSIFFVMFLSYLLLRASHEEGAGFYILYSLILIPVFSFSIVLIGTVLAAAKTKKTFSALFLAVMKIMGYVLLWTIISTLFISVVGYLVYPFFESSMQAVRA